MLRLGMTSFIFSNRNLTTDSISGVFIHRSFAAELLYNDNKAKKPPKIHTKCNKIPFGAPIQWNGFKLAEFG